MPVEQVGEDAAEQDADRAAARRDEAEDAHRLRALGRLREEIHGQRQRDGRGDGAAESLHGARRDQELLRRREAARERGGREQPDAREEQAPLTVEVAEPAAQEEEAAERQQIGVHDPGERGLGEAEIGSDRRQRDVHDRRVEDDHQRAKAENDQRVPTCAAVQRHVARPFGSTSSQEGPARLEELIGRGGNSR